MGAMNDIFRKKYNELDKLCRQKFNMFRNSNGKRESRSAILEYANTLIPLYQEKLSSIVTLRNLIEHEDVAEVNQNVINDLDMFLSMIKSNNNTYQKPAPAPLPISIDEYKRDHLKSLKRMRDDLDLSVFNVKNYIKNNVYIFIDNALELLELASDMKWAERFSKGTERFISYIEGKHVDDDTLVGLDKDKQSVLDNLIESYQNMYNNSNSYQKKKLKLALEKYYSYIGIAISFSEAADRANMGFNELYEIYNS